MRGLVGLEPRRELPFVAVVEEEMMPGAQANQVVAFEHERGVRFPGKAMMNVEAFGRAADLALPDVGAYLR